MIYISQNKINGKRYIGKTVKTLEERWYKHNKDVEYGSQTCFHRAIRKYGSENFTVELLEDCPSELNNEREIHWIATLNPEYNMTVGGDGGWIHDQTGNTWKVKDPSKMGKHKNQWKNDDGSRSKAQSERMKKHNPSNTFPRTEKQREASRRNSRTATEASKKQVGYVDENGKHHVFESKRALMNTLGISYDVLNYRLKTGKLYNKLKFFEVSE
jgi:group I intron endonuclease